MVVDALLKLWKKQGHRVLIFSQSRQMLEVLEKFVWQHKYTYLRLDGGTGVGGRQNLINRFNQDESLFVFLLTTKVGGLGVNLIGANRIIIFDPDWNPSTDSQARERAWRIGQNKQVTIYRLLCSGTIEEKIYHRQIFKQFLTNRVLKDPKQRRLFKSNDLHELFTLSKDYDEQVIAPTETSAIFAGTGLEIDVNPKKRRKKENIFNQMEEDKKEEEGDDSKKKKERPKRDKKKAIMETEEERRKRIMMEKAKELSRKISSGSQPSTTVEEKTSTHDSSPKPCPNKRDTVIGESKSKKSDKDSKKSKSKTPEKGKNNHRKHKKHKGAKFEGHRIKGLKKFEEYKRPKEGEDDDGGDDNEKSQAQDEYVLAKLFKKSGVHSALRHDSIMDAAAPDFAIVEAEAKKVAAEAAARLKASRRLCAPAASGIPSWTGQNGGVVKKPKFGQKKNTKLLSLPETKTLSSDDSRSNSPAVAPSAVSTAPTKFDGHVVGSAVIDLAAAENHVEGILETATAEPNPVALSSAELIKKMKIRNTIVATGAVVSEDGPDAVRLLTSEADQELIEDIRHFIAFQAEFNGQEGAASTDQLLEKFKDKVVKEDTAKFKSMLKEICDHSKEDGKGVWRLKEEFK